ncbi:MAG TPA: carbohydrate binding domain-containing protein [Kofleriaceae bacterium]
MKLAAALALAALAGCTFAGDDYRGTGYRCGPGDTCPAGQHCALGACLSDDAGTTPDAPLPPDAATACSGNLLSNPSFETGTAGWGGVGGSITQITGGHDGDHAAEKCFDGSETYYNVSDNPDTVMGTEVGATYAVSAWVRSASDQTLRAVIRAKDAQNGSLEQTNTPIELKPDWQEVTVQHTVVSPVAAIVEVYFSVEEPTAGDCFQLDDLCFLPVP